MPRDLKPSPEGSAEHKQTMRYWIGRTLQQIRIENGGRIDDVRDELRIATRGDPPHASRLERLEEGAYNAAPGTGWPQGEPTLDQIITAYTQLFIGQRADARDVWERAVTRWRREGGAPQLGVESPQEAFARRAAEAARAHQRATRQGDAASQSAPSAKRSRKKAQ